MNELLFDQDHHRYTVDGVEYPGITSLIKPLTDYDKVPEFMLQRKADLGKALHKECELYIDGLEPDRSAYSEYELQWENGFPAFMAEHPAWFADRSRIQVEQPMAHPKLKYAGTPDLIIDGVAIIEIKTRLFDKKTDPLQLVAQENLWTANGGKKGKYEHFVLELHKDGTYKLVPASNGQAWLKFRFLLEHHWRCIEHAQKIQAWRKK